MKKLASIIDEVVEASKTKIASNSLSKDKASPNISTDIGLALMKVAEVVKESAADISYSDLNEFMERIKNG